MRRVSSRFWSPLGATINHYASRVLSDWPRPLTRWVADGSLSAAACVCTQLRRGAPFLSRNHHPSLLPRAVSRVILRPFVFSSPREIRGYRDRANLGSPSLRGKTSITGFHGRGKIPVCPTWLVSSMSRTKIDGSDHDKPNNADKRPRDAISSRFRGETVSRRSRADAKPDSIKICPNKVLLNATRIEDNDNKLERYRDTFISERFETRGFRETSSRRA